MPLKRVSSRSRGGRNWAYCTVPDPRHVEQSSDWSVSWLSGRQVQDDLTVRKMRSFPYPEPRKLPRESHCHADLTPITSLNMKSVWPCCMSSTYNSRRISLIFSQYRWRIAVRLFVSVNKKTNQVFLGTDHWAPQELNEDAIGLLTPRQA